jgi:hypothetical protein
MKCPHCQTENPKGRKYCSACGKPFQLTCTSCGAVNEPGESYCGECSHALKQSVSKQDTQPTSPSSSVPTSFANGRYQVKKMLSEGGKKKVNLAHDTLLDRDKEILKA